MAIPGDAVYRGKITVQNTKVSGSSDHSNFPVLLTEDNFWSELMDAGSESATNGGGGLRFSSDEVGTTQIAHEVVSFVTSATESSRAAQVWVKTPTLSYNTDTDIHVWSSPTASEEASTSTYGSEAVWVDFKAVWQLHESANTDADGYRDSTGNGWHGTGSGALAQTQPGVMGNAAEGNGSTTKIVTALYPDDTTCKRFTAWLKADVSQNKYVGATSPTRFALGFQGGNFYAGCNGNFIISGTHTAGQQYKLTAIFDSGTCSLYANGALVNSQTYSSPFTSTKYFDLLSLSGAYPIDGSNAFAAIDGVLRSSDWELTEYNNQSDPATFAIAGAFQTGGGSATLTPASVSQLQSVSSPTLTQHNVLAVDSVSQAQTASQPTLTQHHALPVNSATQAQTATAAPLAQHNILLVDNAAQLQSLTEPSMTQHHQMPVDSLSQDQTVNQPTLTQAHILAVAGLSQTQAATAVTLAVAGVLSPAPLTQAQTAGIVTLIQAGVLGVDALVQSQTVTDPALLTKYTLIVDALAQSQALEQSTLSIADVLAAAGLTQTQSAGSVTLTTADALAVDALIQSQSAGAVALTEHGVLAVDSLTQAQLLSISQNAVVPGWLDGTLVITAALGGTLTINPAR